MENEGIETVPRDRTHIPDVLALEALSHADNFPHNYDGAGEGGPNVERSTKCSWTGQQM
jgi:hypothetical protein